MLPILLQIGPITIYSYGFFLALGFLIATFLIFQKAKREYLDEEKVFDAVFLGLIAGIIGARFFYIIEHFDLFGLNFFYWLLINIKPGFSLWGGLGTAIAVFLLAVKKNHLPLFKMFDIVTIPLITAYAAGILGLFLASGEIGTPTTLPWGVVFFSTLKRHPVSLYKFFSSLITLIFIIKLGSYYQRKRIPSGTLFFTFISLQSLWLFILAFLKEDVIVIGRFFTLDHLVYFAVCLTSSLLLYKRMGRNFQHDLLSLKTAIKNKLFLKKGEQNEKIPG